MKEWIAERYIESYGWDGLGKGSIIFQFGAEGKGFNYSSPIVLCSVFIVL